MADRCDRCGALGVRRRCNHAPLSVDGDEASHPRVVFAQEPGKSSLCGVERCLRRDRRIVDARRNLSNLRVEFDPRLVHGCAERRGLKELALHPQAHCNAAHLRSQHQAQMLCAFAHSGVEPQQQASGARVSSDTMCVSIDAQLASESLL